MEYVDCDLGFRRTSRDDLPRIRHWLALPHVQRYWAHDTSVAAVERDFADSFDGSEPPEDVVIEYDGTPIGFIQRSVIHDYPIDHRDLIDLATVRSAALTIDYFIGDTSMLGQGLTTRFIRAFSAACWVRHADAPAIVVPVVVGNVASWSALASAGYHYVTTGFLTPDNLIDDGNTTSTNSTARSTAVEFST